MQAQLLGQGKKRSKGTISQEGSFVHIAASQTRTSCHHFNIFMSFVCVCKSTFFSFNIPCKAHRPPVKTERNSLLCLSPPVHLAMQMVPPFCPSWTLESTSGAEDPRGQAIVLMSTRSAQASFLSQLLFTSTSFHVA